jgi:hypothetical protein
LTNFINYLLFFRNFQVQKFSHIISFFSFFSSLFLLFFSSLLFSFLLFPASFTQARTEQSPYRKQRRGSASPLQPLPPCPSMGAPPSSNLSPSGLLPHPYISLGAPHPRILLPIPSQNRALAATRVSPPSPLPVVVATSILKPCLQIKPCADREKPNT